MNQKEEFTPTQLRMLDVLKDGRLHSKEELHACCGPSSISNVRFHVSVIRKKLKRYGQDVVCMSNGSGSMKYRQVRVLSSAHDE